MKDVKHFISALPFYRAATRDNARFAFGRFEANCVEEKVCLFEALWVLILLPASPPTSSWLSLADDIN